jgi:glycopeptide antibiotics resistance protein
LLERLWGEAMNVYISPIVMGILVSLVIIYIIFIPIAIQQYRRHGNLKVRGNIVLVSFILYFITAWFMTILPLPSMEDVLQMKPIRPNFRPFLFVETFLRNSGFDLARPGTWPTALRNSSFYTVAFNIVLTIPFGIYLRKYFKLKLPWVIVLGFCLSFFYELTQYTGLYGIYPRAYRFPDVDDLIVNTLGTVLGFFLTVPINRLLPDPSNDTERLTEKVSFVRRVLALLVDYITISILFEIIRLVLYWNTTKHSWDFMIYVASELFVFLLLPLLIRKKQTIGMFMLNIYLIDGSGQPAKTPKALLHHFLVGLLLFTNFISKESVPIEGFVIILLQALLILWFLLFIIKSLLQKKICYFWENWLDIYLKAYIKNKS